VGGGGGFVVYRGGTEGKGRVFWGWREPRKGLRGCSGEGRGLGLGGVGGGGGMGRATFLWVFWWGGGWGVGIRGGPGGEAFLCRRLGAVPGGFR